MGAASGVGEQGYNVGRNAALLAGLDHHVPACTVNRFCASSLMTIRMAAHAIRAGEGDQYIAAGVEAVSRAGLGAGMMEEAKHPQLDGSEGSLYNVYIPMGMTAENVAERCSVTREQQDEWAVISQDRAVQARDSGHFAEEIVAVTVPAHTDTDNEGNEIDVAETVVDTDDGPRAGTTMEVLGKLKPAFKPDGTVTAGNSCPLNDGAAAVLVMSDEKATRVGVAPLARIVHSTVAAIRPEIMGLGPIPAIQALLEQTGMTIDEIDIVEINEAFAAQIVPCKQELGISDEQLNPFGGAIALGHPFGMTGARIMTTLLNGLRATNGRYGIEAMCVAGGMGQAMLVERL
jgi:acetyl-CoA C-acetyltransferase